MFKMTWPRVHSCESIDAWSEAQNRMPSTLSARSWRRARRPHVTPHD